MTGVGLTLIAAVSAHLFADSKCATTMLAGITREAQAAHAGPSSEPGSQRASSTSYRISGEKILRPTRVDDDGVHMYLEWSEEQALPAVFALNSLGEEEMVDGYMRQGIFTIDRVYATLVFRIGKKQAKATLVRR